MTIVFFLLFILDLDFDGDSSSGLLSNFETFHTIIALSFPAIVKILVSSGLNLILRIGSECALLN